MENFLRLREIGADQNLRVAQNTRLYSDLAKSVSSTFHTQHSSAINALDFDHTHARYLISAGADTAVHLYDLDAQAPVIKAVQSIPQ